MMDGKIKPNIDKQTAPINDINGPNSGTKAAITTKTQNYRLSVSLNMYLRKYI